MSVSRRYPSGGRARRFVRLALALTIALSTLITAPMLASAQQEPSVRVELESLSPSVLRIDGRLKITGKVINTSNRELRGVSAHLWFSRGPITNLDAFQIAIDSQPYDYYGSLLTSTPSAVVSLTEEKSLRPGEVRAFSVDAENASGAEPMHLTSPGAGYLVGIRIRQNTNWRISTIGSARAFIGSTLPDKTIKTVSVVDLSTTPHMIDAPALFADESLASELTGRLERLLSIAEREGVTTLIDPALLDEVIAMAQGYQIAGTPPTPGKNSSIAIAWLSRVRKVIDRGNVYRTLYGSPDVAMAYASRRPDVLTDAIKALPAEHELARLPLAVVPRSGTTDSGLLDFLAPARPTIVIADTITPNHTVQSTGKHVLISTPRDLYGGGPEPEPKLTRAQKIGRIAVQQIITSSQSQVSVAIARTDDEAELITEPTTWRKITPLNEVISSLSPSPVEFTSTTTPRPAPANFLSALTKARDDLRLWGELTKQTARISAMENLILTRAWSTSFTNVEAATSWVMSATKPQRDAITQGQVAIRTTQHWVLTSDVNALPVTLSNSLMIPVTVRLVFDSQNTARIDIDDTEIIQIPAGESTTVKVLPRARSNGTVTITARLVTTEGNPVGSPVPIVVNANSAGRVGWLIIIGSAAVLLVATALRVKQVRHIRAGKKPTVQVPAYSPQPGGPVEFGEINQADLNSHPPKGRHEEAGRA